ncbi:hypothetical protein BDY19DRAFT_774018 [Irpex rosettiformis]|uniref:Uncharacterized protein n=1 Tax=Irpex rosettiformis TaxID=378272 RepID=A0ACB8U8D8_9APHY|nr:hypothetical protein BDY19DRAFT_774018 [Irpex rosettiformis]
MPHVATELAVLVGLAFVFYVKVRLTNLLSVTLRFPYQAYTTYPLPNYITLVPDHSSPWTIVTARGMLFLTRYLPSHEGQIISCSWCTIKSECPKFSMNWYNLPGHDTIPILPSEKKRVASFSIYDAQLLDCNITNISSSYCMQRNCLWNAHSVPLDVNISSPLPFITACLDVIFLPSRLQWLDSFTVLIPGPSINSPSYGIYTRVAEVWTPRPKLRRDKARDASKGSL